MYAGTDQTYQSPSFTQRWQRAFGIRPDEARTVGLFFTHNFLLGIGTILIYVSANAILLENDPESSLPIAYLASAAAMMGVGSIYAYFEHHLLLRNLAVRVLLAVVVMTVIVGILVVVGHSVAAAVAIMVGYRIIYLLSNLEFWGVSSVVFDTRQSKRLFGVISSGDMPAKALGAVLAALVHAHADVLRLLIVAFAAFLGALYTLRLTIRSHDVRAPQRPDRAVRQETSRLVGNRFGGSELVFFMCLSLAMVAAVGTEIEYSFFINVKHRFHDQTDVIYYVSVVLALTYGLAMLAKLLLSSQVLDRFGIHRSLLVLPWAGLAGLVGLAVVSGLVTNETVLVVYFCGLYLVFEVVRRSLFDPVFLVLFQPLSPPQRLKGHTLAKGFYEPIGLGIAGVFIFILHARPTLETWVPIVWMLMLGGAIWLLNHTYQHYLAELNDAIGRRFLERGQLAMPTAAKVSLAKQLQSNQPNEVLMAIGWLRAHNPDELTQQMPALLTHASTDIRHRALDAMAGLNRVTAVKQLTHIALTDPEPALRQQAAYLLGRRINAESAELAPLLNHSDLSIRQGSIRGVLELNPHEPAALHTLTQLAGDANPARQQLALNLIATLRLTDLAPVVKQHLNSSDPAVVHAAIAAAGQVPDAGLTRYVVGKLTDHTSGRTALAALKTGRADVLPLVEAALKADNDRVLTERVAAICGTIHTPESRRILNRLVQQPDRFVRGVALRALRRFQNDPADDGIFRELLYQEIALAQRILHGSLTNPALTDTLDYELTVLLQRLFDILTQLYDVETIADARSGVGHPARERRANALEMLDNLIPRAAYQTMQALIDDLPRPEKVRILETELGPFVDPMPIPEFILQMGETHFSAWTVRMVLRSLSPAEALAAHNALLSRFRTLSPLLMSHSTHETDQIPEYDRVLLLANTSLFSQTPENVLASITPIMKEETHPAGAPVFHKGDLGTGMYVIYTGEVHILDGETELARFSRGDFFGELALLDTEARSATAEALTDVRLLRLDQADFYDLMEERSEVLRSIVRSLSGRIRRQNELLAGRAVVTSTVVSNTGA